MVFVFPCYRIAFPTLPSHGTGYRITAVDRLYNTEEGNKCGKQANNSVVLGVQSSLRRF